MFEPSFARKSNLIRKLITYCYQVPRSYQRLFVRSKDYYSRPPIVVNSIPKSGTHLLLQIVRALPQTTYYGTFIAQQPSLTMRMRKQSEINFHLRRILPAEVVGAHLHFSEETYRELIKMNCFNMFIYRDPRDVVISEAHYLSQMNRWHKYHQIFKSLPDTESQIQLAITGDPSVKYQNIGARLKPFLGWLDKPDILAIRYEDLVSPTKQGETLERIASKFRERCEEGSGELFAVDGLRDAILPSRSHTFHKGEIERWRHELSESNAELFRKHGGEEILERMSIGR